MNEELELPSLPPSDSLAAIDAQQDEVLRELDSLNVRLELLLRTCLPEKEGELPATAVAKAA